MGTRRQEHWRPKSYPSQNWEHRARDNSITTMQTSVEEEPQAPIPQSIRAVRDANAPYTNVRTLVICLDGTGDKFDSDNSNVVNFVACLKKDDPSQVTYYQSGIGTYDGHGLKGGISAAVDMAVGSGLGIHIKDAYRFLMQNYREGDKICLLGFSRGSYTVRCLAGMLHKVGLLPAHNRAQVSFAYNFYKDDSPLGWEMSAQFKKTFCMDVNVYFVGVWDCVASVGFIPRKLPFGKSPTNSICFFRHAMALDEHRAKFKICQYEHRDPAAKQKPASASSKTKVREERDRDGTRIWSMFSSCFGAKPMPGIDQPNPHARKKEKEGKEEREGSISSSEHDQDQLEASFEKIDHATFEHKHVETDVEEVWFAGCHADVGGGAVPNSSRHMLSRIPLRWMLRQCFVCNTGILFRTASLAETGLDVPSLWPVYKPPRKPLVGPSPRTVEAFEKGELPALSRRATALGVAGDGSDPNASKANSTSHPDYMSQRQENLNRDRNPRSLSLLPEQTEDHFDALAPLNDQLLLAKAWWVLEFWPVKVRIQTKKRTLTPHLSNPVNNPTRSPETEEEDWAKVVRMNMGRFRAVRELEPRMHWTVGRRVEEFGEEEKKEGYKIRNVVDREARWVVVAG